jgi:5S rRNA maturation endonuclease (ribonuclease M5)
MFSFNQVEKLKEEFDCIAGSAIIVEGKLDKRALLALGASNIFEISGKNLSDLVLEVRGKGFDVVTIFTDFDREGMEKAKRLTQLFQMSGVRVISSFRERIHRLLGIGKVEELNSLLKIMEDGLNGKTCSIYDKIFNKSKIFCRRAGGKARCDRGHFWSDRRPFRLRS